MNNQLNIELIEVLKKNPEIIKNVIISKGYKFYEKGLYNTNNFGIRVSTEGGDFDDIIGTVFFDLDQMTSEKRMNCILMKGTTDPGNHYLEKPLNKNGCAILVPGQYFNFQIHKHRGQYDALCQRGIVKVYRDNNKDDIIDLNPYSTEEGLFGVNIHKTSPYYESEMVNKNSGGCQVVYNSAEYDSEWMPIMYTAEKMYGKNFTYTLLEFEDFSKELSKILNKK